MKIRKSITKHPQSSWSKAPLGVQPLIVQRILIQSNIREKIENIMENSLKLLFKWMMMENPEVEKIIKSIWYLMGRRRGINSCQISYLQYTPTLIWPCAYLGSIGIYKGYTHNSYQKLLHFYIYLGGVQTHTQLIH